MDACHLLHMIHKSTYYSASFFVIIIVMMIIILFLNLILSFFHLKSIECMTKCKEFTQTKLIKGVQNRILPILSVGGGRYFQLGSVESNSEAS